MVFVRVAWLPFIGIMSIHPKTLVGLIRNPFQSKAVTMIYGSLSALYPIFSRHHLRDGRDRSLCVFVFQQAYFFKEILDGFQFIFPTVDVIPASIIFVNIITAHK